jgi:hypothetical protein
MAQLGQRLLGAELEAPPFVKRKSPGGDGDLPGLVKVYITIVINSG